MISFCPVTTSRSMTFSSSRTLPGQAYSISADTASGDSVFAGYIPLRVKCWRKCSASIGMSSLRSRSGGTCRWMTFRR